MGTRRPSPCRCLGSTTRCVTTLDSGSTTTRLTVPAGPSLQVASAPIVNDMACAMATPIVVFAAPPLVEQSPQAYGRRPGRSAVQAQVAAPAELAVQPLGVGMRLPVRGNL